jgi:hypothetical protein
MKRAVLMVVSVATLAIAGPASADSGLSGWWRFNEGSGTAAHDYSGHANNGTPSGAQWTSGYFGGALGFDGNSARVDVPDSSSLEPASALTVSAWVKASGAQGAFKYIVSKGDLSCIAASYGLYTGGNAGLQFYISQNGGFSFTVSPDAGTGLWDGSWHFVVGTYDGSSVRLYVDGNQVGTGSPASGSIAYGLSGNDLFIGHYDGCTDHDFAGTIDEPAVWSQALNPVQIRIGYQLMVALHRLGSKLSPFPS